MPWSAVCEKVGGKLVSVGSVVGTLPSNLEAIPLAGPPADSQMWDTGTKTFIARPPAVPQPDVWYPVETIRGGIPAAAGAAISTFDIGGTARTSNAATTVPLTFIPLVAADMQFPGRSTELKVRLTLQTNATVPAAAIVFTGGLHAVTGVAGGANTTTVAFGARLAGSDAAVTNPGASNIFQADSGSFSLPADGRYLLAAQNSVALAATNPRVHVKLALYMRLV